MPIDYGVPGRVMPPIAGEDIPLSLNQPIPSYASETTTQSYPTDEEYFTGIKTDPNFAVNLHAMRNVVDPTPRPWSVQERDALRNTYARNAGVPISAFPEEAGLGQINPAAGIKDLNLAAMRATADSYGVTDIPDVDLPGFLSGSDMYHSDILPSHSSGQRKHWLAQEQAKQKTTDELRERQLADIRALGTAPREPIEPVPSARTADISQALAPQGMAPQRSMAPRRFERSAPLLDPYEYGYAKPRYPQTGQRQSQIQEQPQVTGGILDFLRNIIENPLGAIFN